MSEQQATTKVADLAVSQSSSFKVPGLRWWMMILIMLGSILNYLTRSTLAVAAPTLLKDLRIDEHQYSYILTAFQIAIMFQPICGYENIGVLVFIYAQIF